MRLRASAHQKGPTERSTESAVLAQGLGLILGLTVFAPIFGRLIIDRIFGLPYPILVSVGVVVCVYTVYVLHLRQWITGGLIALVVFSTVNADLPLIEGGFAGNVVGDLLLVYAPIGGLIAVLGWKRHDIRPISLPTYTLGGFVLWSVLSALFGGGPDVFAGLWFALFAFWGLTVFVLSQQAIQRGWMDVSKIIALLVIAVAGHTLAGFAQLLNQSGFGLTRLGEGADHVVATANVPGIGVVEMGTFVSGFTGMSFNLANLLVLTVPALLVFVYRSQSRWKTALLGGWTVVSFVVLRATSTDAGRGGMLIALLTMGVLIVLVFRETLIVMLREWIMRQRSRGTGTMVAALGGLSLLYPSSKGGDRSVRKDVTPSNGANNGAGSSGSGSGSQSASNGHDPQLDWIIDPLTSTSIPLFDLSNIGVRLQQYLIGIDLFLRHPLFGVGGMNYALVAGTYGIKHKSGHSLPLPIHNIYITLLAETGAIGFLLFIGTLLFVMLYSFRLLLSQRSDTLLVISLISGLVGVLAFGMLDVLQLYHGAGFFPLWIVAGVIVGEYCRITQSSESASDASTA